MINMIKDVITAYCYETKDYSKFQVLKGNRQLLERRKLIIEKSVKANGQKFSPIIVNEKYEIIDGQGRFEVFKEHNFPIHYIVREGLTLKDCIILNAASTNWDLKDFIFSYAEQENINYVRLKDLMEKHPQAPTRAIIFALFGSTNSKNQTIRNGLLSVTEQQYILADSLLSYADKYNSLFIRGKGSFSYFTCAVMFCTKTEGMDPVRLFNKFQKYGYNKSINVGLNNMRDCLQTLENVYNFRSTPDSVCYFLSEYDKFCRTYNKNSSCE